MQQEQPLAADNDALVREGLAIEEREQAVRRIQNIPLGIEPSDVTTSSRLIVGETH